MFRPPRAERLRGRQALLVAVTIFLYQMEDLNGSPIHLEMFLWNFGSVEMFLWNLKKLRSLLVSNSANAEPSLRFVIAESSDRGFLLRRLSPYIGGCQEISTSSVWHSKYFPEVL